MKISIFYQISNISQIIYNGFKEKRKYLTMFHFLPRLQYIQMFKLSPKLIMVRFFTSHAKYLLWFEFDPERVEIKLLPCTDLYAKLCKGVYNKRVDSIFSINYYALLHNPIVSYFLDPRTLGTMLSEERNMTVILV